MKIDYYGHSCFAVEVSGKRLMFDPFIRPNPLAASVDFSKLKADYILITHGHEDHLADAVDLAQLTGAQVISNFEIVTWLGKQEVSNACPMNHGGSCLFDFGRVKYVNAIHSSTLPDGSSGGNPGGFVIESNEGNFYYSGDTALTLDMKLIGESTKLNFAVLCIGDHFTMGVEDAIKAADFVGVKEVMGVHYNTFPPIEIDSVWAKEMFQKSGKHLHLPGIGERLTI